MNTKRVGLMAKMLEAIGIAAVMLGLVQGLYGDEWGELYFFLGGIAVFVVGRIIEKRVEKQQENKAKAQEASPSL